MQKNQNCSFIISLRYKSCYQANRTKQLSSLLSFTFDRTNDPYIFGGFICRISGELLGHMSDITILDKFKIAFGECATDFILGCYISFNSIIKILSRIVG